MWLSLSVTCGRAVFSPGIPVSSTKKTDIHHMTDILLKVTLNTINLTPCILSCRQIEDRYKSMAESAKSRSIVSMGLSCFKLIDVTPSEPVANGNVSQCTEEGDQPKSSPNKWTFSVQTFNIIALCQDEYVVEPPSLEFLVDHGFDFNKQYSKGIAYYRGPDRVCTTFQRFMERKFKTVMINTSTNDNKPNNHLLGTSNIWT